jgi:hypothetical protein
MRRKYKGCELVATREWIQGYYPEGQHEVFYHAVDLDDGFMVVESFSEYPTCRDAINGMKHTIDNYREDPSGWRN